MPFGQSEWGIFDQNGGALLTADTVFGFEYTREHRISDYPQEKGAFESYNKVRVPYQAKLTYVIAGSDGNRAQFFDALETIVASLDRVTIVTPEVSYASANVYRHTYRREAKSGAKAVKVDVWCEEVRVVSADEAQASGQPRNIKVTDAQSPNGASTQQDGTVQAVPSNPIPPVAVSPQSPSGTLGAGVGVSAVIPGPGDPAALDPVSQGIISVPF
jgi:hypothetical protein